MLINFLKFHGDRVNGLVSYKGQTYIHTLICIYIDVYLYIYNKQNKIVKGNWVDGTKSKLVVGQS